MALIGCCRVNTAGQWHALIDCYVANTAGIFVRFFFTPAAFTSVATSLNFLEEGSAADLAKAQEKSECGAGRQNMMANFTALTMMFEDTPSASEAAPAAAMPRLLDF